MDISQIPSPCYVIDKTLLNRNLSLIRDTGIQAEVEIILAFKGFAMWGVFPLIRPYIRSISASSVNEARLAHEEMNLPVHTYSPAYTEEGFDEILAYSSHITFNSLSQYQRFHSRATQYKRPVSMGLRVNPELSQVGTDLYNPCSPGSRLGIAAGQLERLPEHIQGLHIHALCESPAEATERLIEAVEQKFGHLFSKIQWLNFGGGHLMTRKGYDINRLVCALRNFRKKYPHIRVILEPGAAFVWETGVLVATIEDIVQNGDVRTAIIDASFTAHMPDCLEMPYKPRIRGASDSGNGEKWNIGGNSCLAGDFMGSWIFEEKPLVGKRIVFEDMIHYTMVKTTAFNGVPHPSIGTWDDREGFTLLRKFGYEDYKNRLS